MLMIWDEPKRELNLRNHRMDFVDARDRFDWDTALVAVTRASKSGRARYTAIGMLDDRLVTLVFSLLGTEAISAISLRPASRKERTSYDEA